MSRIVAWGDVFEDWLDPLGITLDRFRDEMTGSWMFGYVDAFQSAGLDTTIACVTSRVNAEEAWTHRPTGAVLRLLPPTRASIPVARAMLREPIGDQRDPVTLGRAVLRHLAPYLATPALHLARLVKRERCAAIRLIRRYDAASVYELHRS